MEVMDVLEVEESARHRLNRAGVAVPDLWLSRVVRWFPVGVVLTVMAWSYLTVVLSALAELEGEAPGPMLVLRMVLFNCLATMMLWCFFATMVTPPGAPQPEEWALRFGF